MVCQWNSIKIRNLLSFVNDYKVLAQTWKIHTTSSVSQRKFPSRPFPRPMSFNTHPNLATILAAWCLLFTLELHFTVAAMARCRGRDNCREDTQTSQVREINAKIESGLNPEFQRLACAPGIDRHERCLDRSCSSQLMSCGRTQPLCVCVQQIVHEAPIELVVLLAQPVLIAGHSTFMRTAFLALAARKADHCGPASSVAGARN